MNDQHTHAGYAGYDASQTGSYPADPLFGTLPAEQGVVPGPGYAVGCPAGPAAALHDTATHHDAYAGQRTPYAADSSWENGAHGGAGAHPGSYDPYGAESRGAQQPAYDTTTGGWPANPTDGTGQWDSSAWQQAATHTTTGQWGFTDTGAFPATTFESALYETGAYPSATPAGAYEAQAPHHGATAYATGAYETGTYDTSAYDTGTGAHDSGSHATGAYDSQAFAPGGSGYDSGYDTPASGVRAYAPTAFATGAYDSGAYDATAWNAVPDPAATPGTEAYPQEHTSYASDGQHPEHRAPEHPPHEDLVAEERRPAPDDEAFVQDERPARPGVREAAQDPAPEPEPEPEDLSGQPDTWPDPYHPEVRTDGRPEGRSAHRNRARRRSPAKRTALLTIAVPSACVMGVAGIAAASVGGLGGGEETKDDTTTMAAADTATVKVLASNSKLDTQLAGVNAAGADFRDRASRTQERIDLKERQATEKKKREEEAARKEAARPKYLLPVAQHGLSAYFGQAGVNWMSVHTGIDFPVQYGTQVMAATDGTVRTQWNSAYGNMAIVTTEDGTETWYCHLSSTRIRSGPVKAGDVIAYSGNSGNSTGPHLHFEVRPGGGSAINPLAWLQSHGLDPQ
ncbi:peptidoglycan DD-metalloendopeptidase family protein [Streptomyces sp. NBC_00101]|uniref:M23 family metallopeptidase n=1 Tax=Streptomyces sp. NBC_00101 TaxID=2975651 RepID=UPI00325248FB